ncbi:hypothetical protein RhiirA4_469904 [Rhizophagus irregularis]|uniref:Uncharacterized protein n=1 Tax=Rhizophagus irregularis TaxID=588596 RepID=A0A2I1H0B2_9GLOM|nr:hypothetical protein RhiirA4_469904 [Rhizophagus irregularis]
MFTTEFETFAGEIIKMRMSLYFGSALKLLKLIIINKADEREKKWWIDGNYKIIDENRLPLILVEDLPNRDHEVAHGEFTRQFLNALSNVPRQNQVSNTGSTTCSSTPGCRSRGFSKQSDASYTPKQLPKPAANPCDVQSPKHNHKTTQFWLSPNRVEDVIILQLWNWNSRRDQNGIPLRRLTCYKFCRRRSPQNARGDYLPVQTIEFGTIDGGNQPYNECSSPGMCTLNISPRCIYRSCPRQNPPLPPCPITNNVVIDLHDIQ